MSSALSKLASPLVLTSMVGDGEDRCRKRAPPRIVQLALSAAAAGVAALDEITGSAAVACVAVRPLRNVNTTKDR